MKHWKNNLALLVMSLGFGISVTRVDAVIDVLALVAIGGAAVWRAAPDMDNDHIPDALQKRFPRLAVVLRKWAVPAGLAIAGYLGAASLGV